MNKKTILTVSVLALLAGCEKKGATEKTSVSSADTIAVAVVTSQVKGVSWDDWASYSADLRGVEDAMLVTSAAGVVHSISSVGQHVKAGQSLCDIESDRYKVQMDAAKAGADAAQSQTDVTRKNVEAGSVGKLALEGLTAQALAAQSQYLGAKKLYEESRCQAPFDGVVASQLVNRWQAVGPGTPTLRLVRSDKLEVNFTVPEAESNRFKVGVPVEFFLLEEPDHVYKGNVSSIDLAADVRNRTVGAKVVVANVGNRLRPGQVGRARILRNHYATAVVVPSVALLRQENGVRAAVVRDGKTHLVEVDLGSAVGDSVLVRSGLKVGDRLVVEGAFRVSEGTRVKE